MIGGGVLWVLFSAVAAAGEFGSGHVDPGMMTLVYLFGALFYFSLPVAIVIEVVKWARRRKQKQVAPVSQPPVRVPITTPQATSFCTQCGTSLRPVGVTGTKMCPNCHTVYN
jgi:hypothetical protein